MNTLLTERPQGDVFFTGPAKYLPAARRLAERDRFTKVSRPQSGGCLVELCDDEAREHAAEWGCAATEDEAWRYALGAMFGPLDGEYDEHALWINLQIHYREGDDAGESDG